MAAHFCCKQLIGRSCFVVRFTRHGKTDAFLAKCNKVTLSGQVLRYAGDHGPQKMFIKPGSFQDWRAMRAIGFYTLLMGVPLAIIITYVNVFIGQATYSEIPEGYVPKKWEYYPHPISRFIAKNFTASPQQTYEKMAHYIQIESEKMKERKTEREVRQVMRKRGDGPWFYSKVNGPPKEE